MTSFRIDQQIFVQYPDLLLGIVVAQNIRKEGERLEIISELRSEEAHIREIFGALPVGDHPQIVCWREAYRKFGAKPKDYPSSVENLVRRVGKGHAVPHINLLVDLYNTVSVRYIVPAGGEDLDAIQGDVVLTFAGPAETPVRLLGEKEERPPREGEVIYRDDVGAICRRWNWKEAERTKLTENTRNTILVIEALPPVDRAMLQRALDELAGSIQQYCGGNIRVDILDVSTTACVLF